MKNNWLKNNIAEIIAIGFFLFAFGMFRTILLKEVKADSTTEISIVECIKGVLFLIVGFYYGSSTGSKDKQIQLDKQTDKQADEAK